MLLEILQRNPAGEFADGESMDEFADRVLGAIADIAARHGGERVLAITHGWSMDVLAREADGLARQTILHVKPKNGECLWLEATAHSIRPLRHAGR